MDELSQLRLPCGAFRDDRGGCLFRVWAPHARVIRLVLFAGGRRVEREMRPELLGYFSLRLDDVAEGARYSYRLNDGPLRPDPASRFQPDGVHSASAVVDLADFPWTDGGWRGVPRNEVSIYELHVGTFTPEGTFDAAIGRLPELKDLGITALEIMPVAQFPGRHNWGYDGVGLYAVQNSYGGARGLQRLVDAAHAAGLAVIQDVVYNHLGPEGNYLREFGPYFSDRYGTPWGQAVNYDHRGCDPVRMWVLQNVAMWIRDYHMDGLRLDAVDTIYDHSPRHILAEIQDTAAAEGQAAGREVHIIAESDLNDVRLLAPRERGGYSLDAQWADDFHHATHAFLTGERFGYYEDFDRPSVQIARALEKGFIYEGSYSRFRGRRHGDPAGDLDGTRFVICTQNHDQVGNRVASDRLSAIVEPAGLRLAAGLMLLSPYVPMLFMGEEYGEPHPFPFFVDFSDRNLQKAVRDGRRREFAQFDFHGEIPDPSDPATFDAARLTWSWPEGTWHAGLRRLYATLLHARRTWPGLKNSGRRGTSIDPPSDANPVLTMARTDSNDAASRVIVHFNLGREPVSMPARPEAANASCVLRSEAIEFGGLVRDLNQGTLWPYEFAIFADRGATPTLARDA